MEVQKISNQTFHASRLQKKSSITNELRHLAKKAENLYEKAIAEKLLPKSSNDEFSEKSMPLVITKNISGKKVELGIEKNISDGTSISLAFPEEEKEFFRKVIRYNSNPNVEISVPVKEKLETYYAVNSYQTFDRTSDVFSASKAPFGNGVNIAEIFTKYLKDILK